MLGNTYHAGWHEHFQMGYIFFIISIKHVITSDTAVCAKMAQSFVTHKVYHGTFFRENSLDVPKLLDLASGCLQ